MKSIKSLTMSFFTTLPRLLGDMRAYNYVIVPIHDFDQVVYKIRAIDFDQQSYEGKFSRDSSLDKIVLSPKELSFSGI